MARGWVSGRVGSGVATQRPKRRGRDSSLNRMDQDLERAHYQQLCSPDTTSRPLRARPGSAPIVPPAPCCGGVQSFLGQVVGEHHRPPIVHIDHAACTVGGNDDEPIMLVKFDAELSGRCAELANTGSQRRVTILASDQVRLFFRSALINPFEPVDHGCDCPMWPDRPEEWAAGHFLDSSVYRRSAVLGPVRPPTPKHQVCVQGFILLVIDCNSFYASCELRARR